MRPPSGEHPPAGRAPSSVAWTLFVFLAGSLLACGTAAGPGLSWDEPAYRHSQLTLESWIGELVRAESFNQALELFSADQIGRYWEYNRFGHNFHPPLAGLLNVLTYGLTGGLWDEIYARRLASGLEFAGAAAILCHFLGRRYGVATGLFAAASLLFLPRAMGDAHVIGTDMPMLFFWGAAALAFWKGLEDRRWQWAFGALLGCLFLVKFTGAVFVAPALVWLIFDPLVGRPRRVIARFFTGTLLVAAPLAPLAAVVLGIAFREPNASSAANLIARWGVEHGEWLRLLLLGPAAVLLLLGRRRSDPDWPVALELPWRAMAITPLVVVALNPTWWHHTVAGLGDYLQLSLARQEKLPDIGIFYLGERYLYSLPWHNAWVLTAVTTPFGTLALFLVGVLAAFWNLRADRLPAYFLVHAVALPILRMLPTPAHDGVRLFLPTFFFLAGLSAIGARWIAQRFSHDRRASRLAWLGLWIAGPLWAAIDWARIHPFELSYYNIGLRRAVAWGFEPTYWYDAVTPEVLDEINRRLPAGAAVGFPDPLINPEVFIVSQELGRLRPDLTFETGKVEGFPWYWLLSHSSKATAYVRLLYAMPPWLESGHAGVRLFSVVDPKSAATAWALYALTVAHDPGGKPGPPVLHEEVLGASPEAIREAGAVLLKAWNQGKEPATPRDPAARSILSRWRPDGRPTPNLEFVLRRDPQAVARAIDILARRPGDVRTVLVTPGHPLPERFGGYFEVYNRGAEEPR